MRVKSQTIRATERFEMFIILKSVNSLNIGTLFLLILITTNQNLKSANTGGR